MRESFSFRGSRQNSKKRQKLTPLSHQKRKNLSFRSRLKYRTNSSLFPVSPERTPSVRPYGRGLFYINRPIERGIS